MQSVWQTLGLDGPCADRIAIKQAYSRRLKHTRPDDDPAAYQALREAYDWALDYARWQQAQAATEAQPEEAALHADTAIPPQAPLESSAEALPPSDDGLNDSVCAQSGATTMPAEDAPPEFIPPQQLAQDCYQIWQNEGDQALLAITPRLLDWLDALPLALRGEASIWFAEFILQHEHTPLAFIQAMQRYFHWTEDFRADAALGNARAEALRERLLAAHALPIHDPAIHARFHQLFQLDALQLRWGQFLASLIAFLQLPALAALLDHPPALLHALGITEAAFARLRRCRQQAGEARLWLLCIAFAGIVGLQAGPLPALLGLLATPLLIVSLARSLSWLRERSRLLLFRPGGILRITPAWLIGLVIGLPVVQMLVCGLLLPALTPEQLAGAGLVFSALTLIPAWLLSCHFRASTQEDAYVSLLAALCAGYALQGLAASPERRLLLAGLGVLWVNLSMLYWLAETEKVEVFYRQPFAWLKPETPAGWILRLVFFKGYLFAIVASIVLSLPMSLRVLARHHGVGIALTSCLLALALNLGNTAPWLGSMLLSCMLMLRLLQWLGQKIASYLLNRAAGKAAL